MFSETAIVWLRNDLRLSDNSALSKAAELYKYIIPVFIYNPEETDLGMGAASKWWLYHSLKAFAQSLSSFGSELVIKQGSSATTLIKIINETSAAAIFWNSCYEPWAIKQENEVKQRLLEARIEVNISSGNLLFSPSEFMNKEGKPYKVFTPFWNKLLNAPEPEYPLPKPSSIKAPNKLPQGLLIEDLELMPKVNWAIGFENLWHPGEIAAQCKLDKFLNNGLKTYSSRRDFPATAGTSCMSAHLHFGEITPRAIWHVVKQKVSTSNNLRHEAEAYLRELIWREFAYHLLYHFPQTISQPLRPEFKKFPWSNKQTLLKAWQCGQTGYPLIDAGMQELWNTGWMHNRVRMIVASFLVKDLLISWEEGAKWFWDTLIDADLANNTFGWQWAAGCGADAAPYFRIFNPELQSKKFDPDGIYIKRWVPELTRLPNRWIHCPWKAPPAVLFDAGIKLGKDYPFPIVDHSVARQTALLAFESIKSVD